MANNLMESIAEDEAALAAKPETEAELLTDEGEDHGGTDSERTSRIQPKDGRDSTAEARSGNEGTEGTGRRGRRD